MATEPRTLGAGIARAARKHLRLIAAIVVAVTAAASLYSFLAPDRYEARAELLVSPVGSDPLYEGLDVLRDTEDRRAAETLARLVVAPQALDAIRIRLDVADRESLLDSVDVDAVGDSNVVAITGKAAEPTRAAQIANAFADETLAQQSARFQTALAALIDRTRTTLELIPPDERDSPEAVALDRRLRQLSSLRGLPDPAVQKVGDAIAPREPVWPKPELIIPVALVLSALAALALALALEWELVPRPALAPAEVQAPAPAEPVEAEAVAEPAPPAFEPPPPPAPPAPAAAAATAGGWNVDDLERLVAEHASEFPSDQVIEWEAYLLSLRPQAAGDGRLPGSFDWLVEDVFGALLRRR